MTPDPRTVRLNEGFTAEASPAISRRRSKNFVDSVFNLARIYLFFARRYPVATCLTVIAMLLAGFLESFGIVSVAPLLEIVIGGEGHPRSEITTIFARFYEDTLGLPLTIELALVSIVVAFSLKAGVMFLALGYVGFIQANLTRDLRGELINATIQAEWSFFVSQKLGRFTNAATNEAGSAVAIFRNISEVLASAIKIGVFFATVWLVSWQVTVAAIVGGLILWIALQGVVNFGRRAGAQTAHFMKALSSNLADGLGAIKAFKAMGAQEHILEILHADIEALRQAQWRHLAAQQIMTQAREPVAAILIATGLYAFQDSLEAGPGTLLMLLALFYRMFNELGSFQKSYLGIRVQEEYFWLLRDLTETALAARERHAGAAPPALRESVRLKGMSFSYGPKQVLWDADLEIPAGTLVALVGVTGVGKSTIADILCGLQQPDAGTVLIDGLALDRIDLHEWRRQIGYVPQDPILFHETVLANVTLFDRTIDREQVKTALHRAGAWAFVADLPEGLDTIVGERGLRFSGGQRQRIAIARALVRRPRLLILDEATTGLDPETEIAICQTLKSLTPDITIFAISHQHAITNAADRIYRLADGQISEVK